MKAYIVAQLKFTDVTAYRRYQKAFPNVLTRFAAEVIVANETPDILEGNWSGDKVVIIAFRDKAEAMRFHKDPEYLAIAEDRKAGANSAVLLVNGLGAAVRS